MTLRPAEPAGQEPPTLRALDGPTGDPVELFAADLVATGLVLLSPAGGRSQRLDSSDGPVVR